MGFPGFYWVLPSFSGLEWVLLGFTGLLPSFFLLFLDFQRVFFFWAVVKFFFEPSVLVNVKKASLFNEVLTCGRGMYRVVT